VRERIELTGAVDDAAKALVLAEADVLVAPNTHGESFGMVLLEAMAAGAAVVASDLPAFSSVLAGGAHGALFRTGDAVDLAHGVSRMLDDEVGRRRLVERAGTAARRYDWGVLAPRVLDVYSRTQGIAVAAAAG
jgi:phosphatidylinositol alpha-mannosyltransferase